MPRGRSTSGRRAAERARGGSRTARALPVLLTSLWMSACGDPSPDAPPPDASAPPVVVFRTPDAAMAALVAPLQSFRRAIAEPPVSVATYDDVRREVRGAIEGSEDLLAHCLDTAASDAPAAEDARLVLGFAEDAALPRLLEAIEEHGPAHLCARAPLIQMLTMEWLATTTEGTDDPRWQAERSARTERWVRVLPELARIAAARSETTPAWAWIDDYVLPSRLPDEVTRSALELIETQHTPVLVLLLADAVTRRLNPNLPGERTVLRRLADRGGAGLDAWSRRTIREAAERSLGTGTGPVDLRAPR